MLYIFKKHHLLNHFEARCEVDLRSIYDKLKLSLMHME